VADFYAARSGTIPPLPWTNFAPPLSQGRSPQSQCTEHVGRSLRLPLKRIEIGFHRLSSAAWVTETFGSLDLRRCCSREENICPSACASRVHLWTVLAPISSTTGIDLLRSATGIDGFLLTRTCFPELNHGKRSLNNSQYRKTCLTLPLVTKTASSSEPLSISIRQSAFDLTKLLIRNALKSFLREDEYWVPSNSTIWEQAFPMRTRQKSVN